MSKTIEGSNFNCFTETIQSDITKYYHKQLHNIEAPVYLKSYDQRIIRWGIERGLTGFNIDTERALFSEELQELHQAKKDKDTHEIVDALNDMYVVMTQTLGKAGLVKFDITKDEVLKEYFEIYKEIPNSLNNLGYSLEETILETLKEIESRVGSVNPETGKWTKLKTPEAKANWYKADYNKAKIRDGEHCE